MAVTESADQGGENRTAGHTAEPPAEGRTRGQWRARGGFGPGKGLEFRRHLTREGVAVRPGRVERRTASITSEKGEKVFEQTDVEFPFVSQTATNIVAQKYFRGGLGPRARVLRAATDRRVSGRLRDGERGRLFRSATDAEAFRDELTHLLVHR